MEYFHLQIFEFWKFDSQLLTYGFTNHKRQLSLQHPKAGEFGQISTDLT
jgi:hypothetical protein